MVTISTSETLDGLKRPCQGFCFRKGAWGDDGAHGYAWRETKETRRERWKGNHMELDFCTQITAAAMVGQNREKKTRGPRKRGSSAGYTPEKGVTFQGSMGELREVRLS